MHLFFVVVVIAACHASWHFTGAAAARTLAADKKDGPTALDHIRDMIDVAMTDIKYTQRKQQLTEQQQQQQQQPPQPLLVIGAGLPRTGTLSFATAMNRLGVKLYHMIDGVGHNPAHIDLWYRYYVEKTISSDELLDEIARLGYNATNDAPTCFLYQKAMERYPDAKVVMTVRGDGNGEAWQRSFSDIILTFMSILETIPFRWITPFYKFATMHRYMLQQELEADTDPITHQPVVDQLAGAYETWVRKVKRTVPPDKLLVHAAQDGWVPLCDFLSPLSPEIESKCNVIIALGEAYPHVNEKAVVGVVILVLRIVNRFFELVPLIFLVGATFSFYRRRKRRRRHQEERATNKTKRD